ncbi:hypothetical protein VTJ83DRAFT_7259 [Remersonia thermophila]|uniref:Uncharacterized protein n=1 Tax=Remersonia thermophila TaxID=72144 RepID=A0ABR4D599_9PEZI
MGLPTALRSRMKHAISEKTSSASTPPASRQPTLRPQSPVASADPSDAPSDGSQLTNEAIKRATRLRKGFALSASFAYLMNLIFLILVMIGNLAPRPVIDQTYFFKLVLADIIPLSVPNARLINSIAQSIGLHDFYQVGLWNFCEGYLNRGITFCSRPETLYWFNPVSVLMDELLAGATVALPTALVTILDVLRVTSHIMFGFFLTTTILSFLLCVLSPSLPVRSRWWSLPIAFAAFLHMVLLIAACGAATAISAAFKVAAEAQSELNIRAELGTRMFIFMWLATGFAVWGFGVHAGMGCCCTSRRDLRIGRRVVRDGKSARF